MDDKSGDNKKTVSQTNTAWAYDEDRGWININMFLQNIKKIEEELNKKLKKTG